MELKTVERTRWLGVIRFRDAIPQRATGGGLFGGLFGRHGELAAVTGGMKAISRGSLANDG